MHNLTKIRIFRTLLWITYPISVVLIYPFAVLKRKKSSSIFLMLDRYAIGGAQRVYLDILESIKDVEKIVYFTRKSPNDQLKNDFYSFPNTRSHDIHEWCDYLLFRLFSVHYFSFYLSRHKNATILSSNSTFFYDMLPFLAKHMKKIELLHNFSFKKSGMEYFGLANYKYLDRRMVIDKITAQNILDQYRNYGVDGSFGDRVTAVEYGVDLPLQIPQKTSVPPINILYAGRGTAQKRVWILNRIAEHFIGDRSVHFSFAGPLSEDLSSSVKKHFDVLGEIGDKNILTRLFEEHHLIILTSAFEGFPVVVKEGMSYGCVPVVTALPGNKTHLEHLYNSLLLENPEDEEQIVEQGIVWINRLKNDQALLARLSLSAFEYAKTNFSKENFLNTYRTMLLDAGS